MNSNGSTPTPGRGLSALGLLMDFLQVNQYSKRFLVKQGKISAAWVVYAKSGFNHSLVCRFKFLPQKRADAVLGVYNLFNDLPVGKGVDQNRP